MSDLLASELAPDWDADDEKTFYEIIAEIERLRELMRQDDIRIAQYKAESKIITDRTDRNLILLRRAREEDERSHHYVPIHTDSEAAEIDRENAFLRAEVERLSKEKNLAPLSR